MMLDTPSRLLRDDGTGRTVCHLQVIAYDADAAAGRAVKGDRLMTELAITSRATGDRLTSESGRSPYVLMPSITSFDSQGP